MITDHQTKLCIHRHHLFSALDDTALQQQLSSAGRVNLAPQETLFHQGDPAERFYLVIEGRVQLYRTSIQGQDKVIEVVREGNSFAEALMFNRQPQYPVTAQAVSDAVLISFDNHGYLHLLRHNPQACIAIMANMSQRLRKNLFEVEMLSLQNAQNRLLLFFMRNLQPTGADEGKVVLDIPKRVLASRLSIQPETFSRLIKKMLTEGYISESQGTIHIQKINALYASANIPLEGPLCPPGNPVPYAQSLKLSQDGDRPAANPSHADSQSRFSGRIAIQNL